MQSLMTSRSLWLRWVNALLISSRIVWPLCSLLAKVSAVIWDSWDSSKDEQDGISAATAGTLPVR